MADQEADEHSRILQLVVDHFRLCLEDDRTALVQRDRLEPDSLALAALSHACKLLEELNRARLARNSLLAGLLFRAQTETLLTAAWLFLGREQSVRMLLGDLRRTIRLQHEALARSDQRGVADTKQAVRRNRRIRVANRDRRRARQHGIAIDDLPELPVPIVRQVGLDLSGWWGDSGYRDVPEATVSFEMMADQIGPLAANAGYPHANWDSFYNLL